MRDPQQLADEINRFLDEKVDREDDALPVDPGDLEDDVGKVFGDFARDLKDVVDRREESRQLARQLRRSRFRVDEAGGGVGATTIASVLLSAPKIAEMAGKAINRIAGFLRRKVGGQQGEDLDETKVGKLLIRLGHKLEDTYVAALKKSLWALSKTPIISRKLNLDKVDEEDLNRTAKILFYAILVIAAGKAFSVGYKHIGSAMGAFEVTLGSIKIKEVLDAVYNIVSEG